MSAALLYTLASVLLVSAVSLIGIFTLSLREGFIQRMLPFLVSLAVGALFGDAFIHLLPQAFASLSPERAAGWVLAGIIGFLILEKFFHWHHSHEAVPSEPEQEPVSMHGTRARIKPIGWLVTISDGLHNVVDGMIIAASFLVSVELGIATTLAVILHEIPQEISDFALLIHAGFRRVTALLVNFASGLTALGGALFIFALQGLVGDLVPIMTAVSAGAFIYIAGSDLVPELHKTTNLGRSLQQLVAILLGIGLMFGLLVFEGERHGHGDEPAHADTHYRAGP